MRQKRVKWIRKVVFSKHPKIMEMIKEKFDEEHADKMTYKQVINCCKKFWKEQTPGVEEWCIYENEEQEGES